MDALQSMETYLSTRPSKFPSLASGIEWQYVSIAWPPCCSISAHVSTKLTSLPTSTRSRSIRSTMSARVSVPSLLREESEPSDSSKPWTWRTNLAATKPYWENWFIGLSKKFLEARGGKLLLLAGTDRLDKELIIGQMQGMLFISSLFSSLPVRGLGGGLPYSNRETNTHLLTPIIGKYQLQVFPEAGHFIQEDQPSKTAQILVDFYKRNDRSALVLSPKVGDMGATAALKKAPGGMNG